MMGGGSTGLRSVKEADVVSVLLVIGVSSRSYLFLLAQRKPWPAVAPDEQSGCMHCYAPTSSVRLPAFS